MMKKILISGGGIAGLTAAQLLHAQGHDVTVIDRAHEFTNAGFLISLKSFGVKIMEELGLVDALRAIAVPSVSMEFVDSQGRLIRHFRYEKMAVNTQQSITLTRGDLHQVLYNAVKDKVRILLGTTIDNIQQAQGSATVTLSNQELIKADLVIVSEGLRSFTREQYFPDAKTEDFHTFYVGGRLKTNHTYEVGHFKTFIDVGSMLSIYPISNHELAIQCYIANVDNNFNLRDNISSFLRQTFDGHAESVKTLFTNFLENGSRYADSMGMVHAPDLINEQLLLLGDAGYCPTALSGMGASLSIYGAKALSHFLALSPSDLPTALQQYNTLMQPIINKFQNNAKTNAASFLPKSPENLQKFIAGFRGASEADAQKRMTEQMILSENQLRYIIQ